MMPSRYCKSCGCYIPDDWKNCPACFTKQVNEINKSKSKIKNLIDIDNGYTEIINYGSHIRILNLQKDNFGFTIEDKQKECEDLYLIYKKIGGNSMIIDYFNSLYKLGKISTDVYRTILREEIKK